MVAVVFQRKAVNKRKKKGKELERDSHEFPSFSEMISDAGMALFPGYTPFRIMPYTMKVDFLRQNLFLQFERKRLVLTGKEKEKQQAIVKVNKCGM